MKILKICSITILIIVCSSFKDKPVPVLLNGSYGSCNCGEADNSENPNALLFNEDQSYVYNNVNSENKIEKITGTWSIENGKIVLSNTNNDLQIPDRWEIDKKGKCIKGRKGLAFFRLCHIESCKE
jgi:hypothetical protein